MKEGKKKNKKKKSFCAKQHGHLRGVWIGKFGACLDNKK